MSAGDPIKPKEKTLAERLLGKNVMGTPLAKRFYSSVSVSPVIKPRGEMSFGILLDGRPVKTPKKRALEVLHRSFADAIAGEWLAQDKTIDPASMPLTRIANTAIDAVAGMMPEVAADIVKYASSDLVCYRAEGPDALVARQNAVWDKVLTVAHKELGARFVQVQGIIAVAQPESSLEKIAAALSNYDRFELTGLHVITTLTGSALLALALGRGAMSPGEVWAAAHLDEDWQIEQWGSDEEAEKRRAQRSKEFNAAASVLVSFKD